MRELSKKYFDKRHRIRQEPLEPGMLVLSHDTAGAMDMSADRKLSFRWFGPFRIDEADPVKGTYTLKELDGAKLKGTFAGNRLKRFYPRAAEVYERELRAGSSMEGADVDAETVEAQEDEDEDEEDVNEPAEVNFSHQHAGEMEDSEEDEDEEEQEGERSHREERHPPSAAPRRSQRLQARSNLPKAAERVVRPPFPDDGIVVEVPRYIPSQRARRSALDVEGETEEDWELRGED